jgi:hypothetical protein
MAAWPESWVQEITTVRRGSPREAGARQDSDEAEDVVEPPLRVADGGVNRRFGRPGSCGAITRWRVLGS